jgi:hypothetical protein
MPSRLTSSSRPSPRARSGSTSGNRTSSITREFKARGGRPRQARQRHGGSVGRDRRCGHVRADVSGHFPKS